MSYTSPDLFHYSGKPYVSSLAGQGFGGQPQEGLNRGVSQQFQNIPRGMENFGESQVNNIYRPISYPSNSSGYNPAPTAPLPLTPNHYYQMSPQDQDATRKLRGPSVGAPVNNNERYDEYLEKGKDEQYKYNVFSAFDEPWNRCVTGEKCGKFPSNECIASSSYRKYWK